MSIDPPVEVTPPATGWLSASRARLLDSWSKLLVIGLVWLAVGFVLVTLAAWPFRQLQPVAGGSGYLFFAAADVATTVITAVGLAWMWTAAILWLSARDAGAPPPLARVIRDAVRRMWPLAAWFVLLHLLLSVPHLYRVFKMYNDEGFWNTHPIVVVSSFYLTFATSLLPLVVVLERRGIVRAWRITHDRWRVALSVVTVLAMSEILDRLFGELPAAFQDGLIGITAEAFVSTGVQLLMVVGLYSIYVRRAADSPAGTASVPA